MRRFFQTRIYFRVWSRFFPNANIFFPIAHKAIDRCCCGGRGGVAEGWPNDRRQMVYCTLVPGVVAAVFPPKISGPLGIDPIGIDPIGIDPIGVDPIGIAPI